MSWSSIFPVLNNGFAPMFGFKRFDTAKITISGVEFAQKIRKQQFTTRKFPEPLDLLRLQIPKCQRPKEGVEEYPAIH